MERKAKKHIPGYIRLFAFFVMQIMCVSMMGCAEEKTSMPKPTLLEPTATPKEIIPDHDIDYSYKELSVFDIESNYKVQCRSTLTNNGLALDYTAAAIEFNAFCEGDVSIGIRSKVLSEEGSGIYFSVETDGRLSDERYHISDRETDRLIIAQGLTRGYHTFKVIRQTEAEQAECLVTSVMLSGELYDRPADKPLFIEFVGDSHTTAYGNIYYSSGISPASPIFQDGTKSFAYLTARELDVDYSIIAQQGIGIVCGWYPHTMLKTYKYTCFQKSRKTIWEFDRKADIVVINLGENDYGTMEQNKVSVEEIQEGMIQLISLVKEKNNNAKVLWVYGLGGTHIETLVKNAINESGGRDAGCHFLKVQENHSGGNGHSDVAGHELAAEAITAYIKENMM